jgi:alpha-L-arabinofuranosidase
LIAVDAGTIEEATGEMRAFKSAVVSSTWGRRSVRALVLAGTNLKAENSLAEPTKLSPAESRLEVSSNELVYKLAPNSLNVLRIPR